MECGFSCSGGPGRVSSRKASGPEPLAGLMTKEQIAEPRKMAREWQPGSRACFGRGAPCRRLWLTYSRQLPSRDPVGISDNAQARTLCRSPA